LEDHLPIFECDPFRFEQIFINLVQNSLRYTDQGGITIECKRQSDAITFTVSDTGSGIDPVHLPRIFERFYVGDPSRNRKLTGTGLGLAIVKHIVLMHGGTICANSSPGKGTSIEMSFPLTNTYAIE
jgi:two-component system phosphate regulon sensor histidine kinase PhoR